MAVFCYKSKLPTMKQDMKRINVIGTSGSGKSTVSHQIAEKLNLPYIELEELCWQSNWTELSDAEFFPKVQKAVSSDGWVLDGTYPRTRHIKWERVQMVVYLDLPLHIVLYRVLRRTLLYIFKGQLLWAGNKETFWRAFFSYDSIILWSLKTFFKNRKDYLIVSKSSTYSHIKFVRLRSNKEIENFVAHLSDA